MSGDEQEDFPEKVTSDLDKCIGVFQVEREDRAFPKEGAAGSKAHEPKGQQAVW